MIKARDDKDLNGNMRASFIKATLYFEALKSNKFSFGQVSLCTGKKLPKSEMTKCG